MNPLSNASFETLDKVSKELNEKDIDLLYEKIKKIDETDHRIHAVNAAYHAAYKANTYPDYSLVQMREHIYNLTCCGFNKILLTPEEKDFFLDWTEKIEELPDNATPFEIYYCASPRIFPILGR